jgi:hypothetical protein
MSERSGKARELHLDVSENYIEQYLDELTNAIAVGLAPSSLTIRLLEFEKESDFRSMVNAIAINNTIRHLDISRASLPCEASEETCQALERMFAENTTLEWLDMSGEDSRLETTKLGVGINKALRGLQHNSTLRVLFIKCKSLYNTFTDTDIDDMKIKNLDCRARVHSQMSLKSTRHFISYIVRTTASHWVASPIWSTLFIGTLVYCTSLPCRKVGRWLSNRLKTR